MAAIRENAGFAVPSWEKFGWRFLIWPSVVQVSVVVALGPISWLWCRYRCSETRLIARHVGTKHRKPINPYFLAWLLAIQLVSSLVSVSLWIRRTYVRRCDDFEAEVLISVSFAFGYLVRVLKNEFRPVEAMTLACVVDVYCSVPLLMENDDSLWVSLSFLRVFRALDALNQIESTGVLDMVSDFRRALMFLVLRTMCMIVVLAGIVFTLEVLGELPTITEEAISTGMGDISFMSILYFSISTISTVGYGDFSPSTLPSRMFVCLEIVVGVIFFSVETTNIMELKNLLNTGKGSYRLRAHRNHVLVIGGGVSNAGEVLTALLKELYGDQEHFDPGWPDAVMLCPSEADRSLKSHLKTMHAEKRRHVWYFVGSPMVTTDLDRVCLQEAKMVYVIADVSARDKRQEDGFNLLRALSVRKHSPHVPMRLMVLRPEFKERAVNAGLESEHCFSVDEMKATFLAHCCRCPGFITVISNLTDSQMIPQSLWGSEIWKRDYVAGTNNAIYGMLLSEKFEGMTWSEAMISLYRNHGAIVVAAQVDGRVILNPGNNCHNAVLGNEVLFVIAAGPDQLIPASNRTLDWEVVFNAHRKRASQWLLDGDDTSTMPFEGDHPFKRRGSWARLSKMMSRGRSMSILSGPKITPCSSFSDRRRVDYMHRDPRSGGQKSVQENGVDGYSPRDEVSGHVVLISCSADRGVHWNEIALTIATLRTPLRPWEHRPIYVLSTEAPPASLAKDFKDVSFYVGTPSSVPDLEAVMVRKAGIVVLLAGDAQGDILSELRDHTAIVVANTLDLLLSNSSRAYVMYELHIEDSAKFMPCPLLRMEGCTAIGSLHGCASSRHRASRLKGPKLNQPTSSEILPVKMDPQFACGQVFSLSFLGEMLGREYYVPSTMELLQALVMPARRGQSSFPWLVDIPEDFWGRTFDELFEAWTTSEDMAVPLSIYRNLRNIPEQYGYVVTNPGPDYILSDSDRVYVLASASWGQQASMLSSNRRVRTASSDKTEDNDGTSSEDTQRLPFTSPSFSGSARASYISAMSASDYEDRRSNYFGVEASRSVSLDFQQSEDRMGKQITAVREELRATESQLTEHLCRIERQLAMVAAVVAPGSCDKDSTGPADGNEANTLASTAASSSSATAQVDLNRLAAARARSDVQDKAFGRRDKRTSTLGALPLASNLRGLNKAPNLQPGRGGSLVPVRSSFRAASQPSRKMAEMVALLPSVLHEDRATGDPPSPPAGRPPSLQVPLAPLSPRTREKNRRGNSQASREDSSQSLS